MDKILRALAMCMIITIMISSINCSKAKAPNPVAPPPVVEVIEVEQRDVSIYSEWIATLDATTNAQIKGQVSGYIISKNYTEGTFVKKGDLLFQIDPRPFQSTLEQAKGELAKAENQLAQANSQYLQAQAQLAEMEANLVKVQLDLKRAEPLARNGIISQQDVDNTVQANRASEAHVRAGQAAVETAKAVIKTAMSAVDAARATVANAEINLGFTKITSPMDGIANIAQAQVGDLISVINPNGPPLTTISNVNPIKAYFPLTEQEYLKNTRYNTTQKDKAYGIENLELEMVLADGIVYPYKGKAYVADSRVDPKTGTIHLIGVFENPGNILRPGQYARIRAATSKKDKALLVPQRAVTELQGRYQVAVVDKDNKIDIRTVTVGERVGSMWIINEGLTSGETVVAEGTQKVRPNITVTTKPFTMPTTISAQH